MTLGEWILVSPTAISLSTVGQAWKEGILGFLLVQDSRYQS